MDAPITHTRLIELLEGPTAVARLLGIKPPSVMGWRENGIPDGRLQRLAVIAEQRGHCKRWDLFPTDWHRIWPELIATEGAPPVPEAVEVRDAA